jgi:hypothetical protein
LEDGAEIPDELLRAAVEGRTVFLCGAGVSCYGAKMPLFDGLTTQVYAKLGETDANEYAERHAIERKEYDRALRSLEKRTHRPRTDSRVRAAIIELLTAKDDAHLYHHRDLLQISRDGDGRPKLLTTNFDTLFERAARAAGWTVPSHGGKSIPKPGGARDHGILHLHGRIPDEKLGLEETELILTSADFGDAYLRDGWASQYIEDRMRLNTLVLVGYAAEDPALRLLLETLDADRERFRDMQDIYAIEKQTDGSASMWKAKGIKPIEFSDYGNIYATIAEWARYAARPSEYGDGRIRSILFQSPGGAGSAA